MKEKINTHRDIEYRNLVPGTPKFIEAPSQQPGMFFLFRSHTFRGVLSK
jgi:hypothetical protein